VTTRLLKITKEIPDIQHLRQPRYDSTKDFRIITNDRSLTANRTIVCHESKKHLRMPDRQCKEKSPQTEKVRGPKDYLLIHPELPARLPACDALESIPGHLRGSDPSEHAIYYMHSGGETILVEAVLVVGTGVSFCRISPTHVRQLMQPAH
jgi:hypothetical protein